MTKLEKLYSIIESYQDKYEFSRYFRKLLNKQSATAIKYQVNSSTFCL